MNNNPLKLDLHKSDITWQLELNPEKVDPILHGVGYLAWTWIRISLESWMVSWYKVILYELVSQITCISVSIFWYSTYTFPRTWAQGGSPFFETFKFFGVSADRRLVRIRVY
jgi:hypothetical protein